MQLFECFMERESIPLFACDRHKIPLLRLLFVQLHLYLSSRTELHLGCLFFCLFLFTVFFVFDNIIHWSLHHTCEGKPP